MKSRFLLGSAFVGATVLVAVACSNSTPPPDSTITEFCNDWASAWCQVSSSCEIEESSCLTYQNQTCQTYASERTTGTRQYSQPGGKACINALNQAFGNGAMSVSTQTVLAFRDTCERAFPGSALENQTCTTDYDCTDDLVCDEGYGQTSSVCSKVTMKNLNDPCADPGDECQGDTYCASNGSMPVPVCTPTPGLGAACSDTVPCSSGEFCAPAGFCVNDEVQGQEGCTNDDQCGSGLFCDTYPPSACVNALTFSRGGIDCQGIDGTDMMTSPVLDAGTPDTGTDSATTPEDAGTDSAAATDATPE
jgi:hypothetical protein